MSVENDAWASEESPHQAIARLIELGAMRLCPRCQYVPNDREETIFEPLGITTRSAWQYVGERCEPEEVTMTVLTLVCTHCGYIIEHCLDYLERITPSTRWEDYMYVGLGPDPEYDVLDDVSRILGG
jgi:hypothetical protein